jgi:hypothetical protein
MLLIVNDIIWTLAFNYTSKRIVRLTPFSCLIYLVVNIGHLPFMLQNTSYLNVHCFIRLTYYITDILQP